MTSCPLIVAAKNDNLAHVIELIAAGTSVDEHDHLGYTALHWASDFEYIPIMKELIARGANPNAESVSGWTPLHKACASNRIMAASLLLDAGARTDIQTRLKATAVDIANEKGFKEIHDLLLLPAAERKLRLPVETVTAFAESPASASVPDAPSPFARTLTASNASSIPRKTVTSATARPSPVLELAATVSPRPSRIPGIRGHPPPATTTQPALPHQAHLSVPTARRFCWFCQV
eukprot:TRINITY_DN11065_c0_g1_i2.p1 TRINITY_DN11065_c0_g1~~TRINITY_DN11065_c0_g1_i2.p1  ORF type:complete len:234 (-),score=35.16 TRINITY_DN11065_c0_g1_i2:5-706(-)